jgi:hypothetical protein
LVVFKEERRNFLNEQKTKACTSCYGFFVTLQVSKGNKRSKRKKKERKKPKKKGKEQNLSGECSCAHGPAQLQQYQQFFPRHRTYVK